MTIAGDEALRAHVLGERGRIARLSRIRALAISLVATGLALFGLGAIKGRVTRLAVLRSGLEVLVVGGASAGIGYLIGGLGPRPFFDPGRLSLGARGPRGGHAAPP